MPPLLRWDTFAVLLEVRLPAILLLFCMSLTCVCLHVWVPVHGVLLWNWAAVDSCTVTDSILRHSQGVALSLLLWLYTYKLSGCQLLSRRTVLNAMVEVRRGSAS
jgi:hypothetical protein